MENDGITSVRRNRRLDSYFDREPLSNLEEEASEAAEEVVKHPEEDEVYVEDNGWFSVLICWVRIVSGFMTMLVATFIWSLILLVFLPWPYERIRQANTYGHVAGRLVIWILGNSVKIEGAEYSNKRAIYISNHASNFDIFLLMWLIPTGTVGVAKKEIIWYPLFGQFYVLANNLRIDRSNPPAAIKCMKEVARAVAQNNLSLIMCPEGRRSKDGRLLPFKKGFVHLALQTRLPIVPIVMTGTHKAWKEGGLHFRPAPITVKYLPPIETKNWADDKINEYVNQVRNSTFMLSISPSLKDLFESLYNYS